MSIPKSNFHATNSATLYNLQVIFHNTKNMTTLVVEQELTPQNSPLDCLYCEESHWNYDDNDNDNDNEVSSSFDEEQEEEHLLSLLCKEEKTHMSENALLGTRNFDMMEIRREILGCIVRVSAHYNFSVVTLVLAVNYFDKYILNVGFQRERCWMTQLAAVACLSLASKFEETQVPPLLEELQVECKYIFEARTIKRMELLILSTLDWNMNAVTPFSYFGHFLRKFRLKKNHLHSEILSRFESLTLSAIFDPRFLHYVPSVLAAAIMVQTLKELGVWDPIQHQIHFANIGDKVEECYKFIQEIAISYRTHSKRKCCGSGDSSPTTVLSVVSSESLFIASPPSPELVLPKKCRTSESRCD